MNVAALSSLPREILFPILTQFPLWRLGEICKTYKELNYICESPSFWEYKFRSEFNKPLIETAEDLTIKPELLYLRKRQLVLENERNKIGQGEFDLIYDFLSPLVDVNILQDKQDLEWLAEQITTLGWTRECRYNQIDVDKCRFMLTDQISKFLYNAGQEYHLPANLRLTAPDDPNFQDIIVELAIAIAEYRLGHNLYENTARQEYVNRKIKLYNKSRR